MKITVMMMAPDTSNLHHAFISIFIALWDVITLYISILMAILSYFTRFTMKRGNAGSWNSGWKRSKHWEPILHCSKRPETPQNLLLELIRIIEQKKHLREPTPWPGGWGRAHPYWAPLSPEPPGGPPVSIFCYMKSFDGKNQKPSSRTKLRCHEAEPWRNKSRGLAELFCRGNFPPGGGNHRHSHHQHSSHRERAISINIFTSTISSQNPSSSLVSNSCHQVRDWC